ncbi:MAG: PD-(D/E)XK nuclease family protein [Acidimicrobiia bacterium]|nr:PD-(D/E)XK nuclease family protein [Acidimicrobiia bacterium]
METHTPPITLSPSRMSDFKLCPQLFKFRAIDRLPDTPSEPALRGTAVHAALEALFTLPPTARVTPAAIDLLDRAWAGLVDAEIRAQLFPDPATEAASRDRAREHVEMWFTLEDPTRLEPAGRELRLRSDIGGGIAVQGIIDRLDRTPTGDWVISDYKCGRTPELERSLSSFFGLDVYALLLTDVIGSVPRHLRLIYLDSGDIFVMDPKPADVERTRKMLRSLAVTISKVISEDDWRARPKPFCNHCSFRAVCPAWSQSADPVTRLPVHV